MPTRYLGRLISAILPIGDRKYFAISDQDLSPEKRQQLIDAYAATMNGQVPKNELVVYAVTAENATYLLPEFYRLKETEQAAILFHEAEWILNPKLTYGNVIDGEMKFQAYVENAHGKYGYDSDLFSSFDLLFNNNMISLKGALIDDLAAGRLAPFLNSSGSLPLSILMSEKRAVVNGGAEHDLGGGITGFDPYYVDPDRANLALTLSDLISKYPNIKSFERLYSLRNDLQFMFWDRSFIPLYEEKGWPRMAVTSDLSLQVGQLEGAQTCLQMTEDCIPISNARIEKSQSWLMTKRIVYQGK